MHSTSAMHSASLTSLLKLESLLEDADEVLSPELLQVPAFRRIQEMISEVLQRVTTERLRVECAQPQSG